MSPALAVSDIVGIAKRNLLRIARTPQLLFFARVQPVMVVLLFRYVFGGAIRVPGLHYVGFRFHNNAVAALAGILVVLAFGYAFAWIFATIGLAVKDPETAQVAGFLPLFPLVFASSAYVPVKTMPGWLQGFAHVQPASVTINAVRALMQGGPVYHWLWQVALWSVGIFVVLVAIAVRQYRSVAS